MRVRSRAFWAPKAGNTEQEYEDAAWPLRPVGRTTRVFRCAVADGATETSFACLWARMLTRAYARGALSPVRRERHLARLRSEWLAAVTTRSLPWYAEEKVRAGAFSSLLGLTLQSMDGGRIAWHATAIGDSCLAHVRGGRIIQSFPLEQPEQFNTRPCLLSSRPSANGASPDCFTRVGGCALPGDSFLLMTDALACWALGVAHCDDERWDSLRDDALTTGGFAATIDALRAEKSMRNDDVTILRVDLERPE